MKMGVVQKGGYTYVDLGGFSGIFTSAGSSAPENLAHHPLYIHCQGGGSLALFRSIQTGFDRADKWIGI
jgi:hypothetical protein